MVGRSPRLSWMRSVWCLPGLGFYDFQDWTSFLTENCFCGIAVISFNFIRQHWINAKNSAFLPGGFGNFADSVSTAKCLYIFTIIGDMFLF